MVYNGGKTTSSLQSSSGITSSNSKPVSIISSSTSISSSSVYSSINSSNTSSSVASSSDASSKSSSSTISVNSDRVFSNENMAITFIYDKDWTVPTVSSFGALSGSGVGGYEAALSKNGSTLKFVYYTNSQNTGGPIYSCLEPDAVLEIGSGWRRLRARAEDQSPFVNIRYFTNEVPLDSDVNIGSSCPSRSFILRAGPGQQYGKFIIELRDADNQRDVADEIIRSIKFK